MRTRNDVPILPILTVALWACSISPQASEVPAAATQGDEAPLRLKTQLQQADSVQTVQPQAHQPPQSDAPDAAKPALLSGGQMLDIVAYIDAREISQGHVALDRASSAQVRDFARQLVSDNDEALRGVERLAVERSDLNLMPSDTSQALGAASAELLARLNAADNGGFDRMYIEAELDEQAQGLELLRQTLIPACDPSSPVHAELIHTESLIAAHLEKGRRILASLSP